VSKQIDFLKLEEELWASSFDGPDHQFLPPTLSPVSVGLASVRMKRWTARLIRWAAYLLFASVLLWATKTHHILKVSTQDGVVKSVELLTNER